MAWKRIDDKQLAWDLMRSGLLYIKCSMVGEDVYALYDAATRTAWEQTPENKEAWFSPENARENYIQIED